MAIEISMIIPAFNEEKRLEPTIREAVLYLRDRRTPFEVIVVDDGSGDGTGALVNRLTLEYPELLLIRLPGNRGKGYAVRTGVVNSRGTRVLFSDADGATPIAEIVRLERALEQGADVAIGSREMVQEGVRVQKKAYRRFIGRVFHLLVSRLTVAGYRDTQCGFKLFSARAAHELFSRMRMDGFSFDVELLMMAARRGFKVTEVAVNWTHKPGSRLNLVTDSLRMARDLLIIRGSVLRGDYERPRLTPLPGGSVVDTVHELSRKTPSMSSSA